MFRDRRVGGIEHWSLQPPPDAHMLIPDMTRDCVVYLGTVETKARKLRRSYWGTGFFVDVAHPTRSYTLFPYLVTARHVVVNHLAGRHAFMRINRLDGGAENVTLNAPWYFHPDKAVDVAVLPLDPVPDVGKFKFTMINRASFATDDFIEQRGIGAGDEVFVTGLFGYVAGEHRNIPIVRMGNVAMLPREPVPTGLGDTEVYLIEARSIGGISGSPVFVRESIWIPRDPARPFIAAERSPRPDTEHATAGGKSWLFGLMHGHWDIPPKAKNDIVSPEGEGVNIGIAMVVPAKMISAVLDDPALVRMRQQELGLLQQQFAPKMD